jgi:hypothetical protein
LSTRGASAITSARFQATVDNDRHWNRGGFAESVKSTVYADESSAWDALHARFLTRRINHSKAYSTDEDCTNWAESYFYRMRRAEIGTHHHVAGPYLEAYASEMAWREDNRRRSNGANTSWSRAPL